MIRSIMLIQENNITIVKMQQDKQFILDNKKKYRSERMVLFLWWKIIEASNPCVDF